MHKQFRRFDIVVGAVFVVLVIVGLLTVHSGSKPVANSSHAVRATAAAGPASAPAVVRSGTMAPPTAPPPTRSKALRRPPPVSTSAQQAAPDRATPATRPAPPPPTQAPPPPPPATQAAPAAPATCTPKTNAGNCYEPGEFCRTDDRGTTGVAGDGKAIRCEDNDGWRWEPI